MRPRPGQEPGARVPVLLAAAEAPWEAACVRRLSSGGAGVVLLKRCVDLADLLATAATGQAQVAVVALTLPGLDVDSVSRLRAAGVRVVAVTEDTGAGDAATAARLGVDDVAEGTAMAAIAERVAAVALRTTASPRRVPEDALVETTSIPERQSGEAPGRLVAVWGPAGAPGRTTVAVGLAAELAHRGAETLLVDLDGYGGAVAQHLGVLDETSGLLAAARLGNSGHLDGPRLAGLAREVATGLRVLTGLPRADRWPEVRPQALARILELLPGLARHVVLDTGFSIEREAGVPFDTAAPARNEMTVAALEAADEVLLVGSADPVGLARLARALVELKDRLPGCSPRVVVNRARPSLGWSETEVRAMIEGFVRPLAVHFLPDDRPAADRALVAGTTLVEAGDSALRRGLAAVVDGMVPTAAGGRTPRARGGLRSRRAGTAR